MTNHLPRQDFFLELSPDTLMNDDVCVHVFEGRLSTALFFKSKLEDPMIFEKASMNGVVKES